MPGKEKNKREGVASPKPRSRFTHTRPPGHVKKAKPSCLLHKIPTYKWGPSPTIDLWAHCPVTRTVNLHVSAGLAGGPRGPTVRGRRPWSQ